MWLTRVWSNSMAPALRHGQFVPTKRLRRTATVRRGDVVVIDSAEVGSLVVKRVIGLPGEHVSIRAGRVRIDGRELDEPYAAPSHFDGDFDVPAAAYVVLGDNRDASSDSRSWRQPFVERRTVRGRLACQGRRRSPARAGSPTGRDLVTQIRE